jgi:transposase
MKTLSLDLRERIVAAYDRGDGTRLQIAERFAVSESMVKKLLKQRVKTGDLASRHANSGRKPTIGPSHERRLRRLVAQQPDLTLSELRDALELDVTPQAVHYALERLALPLKKRRSSPLS